MYTARRMRKRRVSSAPHPGGASQPQSHLHQGGHRRDETQMADTAEAVGAEAGGEKLQEQTKTRVRWCNVGSPKPPPHTHGGGRFLNTQHRSLLIWEPGYFTFINGLGHFGS